MSETVRQTVVSAPGKVILMGEHAAVYGHPAVVAAIDLRLTVTAARRDDDRISIALPELEHSGVVTWNEIIAFTDQARARWERAFTSSEADTNWTPEAGPPDRLVQLALGETLVRCPQTPQLGTGFKISSKLPLGSGFGSSAALAAGVANAYLGLTGVAEEPDAIQDIAHEVERRQHGTPSGVDHNAVIRGGLLWAHRDGDGELVLEPIRNRSPLLACLRLFHSGNPAESTGVLVAAVRERIQRAGKRFIRAIERIDQATHDLRKLLLGGENEPSRLIALIRQSEAALEELGVVPEPIRRIIRKIEAAGGAAKISGAGALTGEGGGSILVYHPEPEHIAGWDFLRSWLPLPVRLGTEGLRSEARPSDSSGRPITPSGPAES
ncbi:MAG: hypothetical protein CMJ83_16435 [Planctomycetes bacterium]|nr:hypothetical protein [Planctomycetota bacterium]